MSDKPSFVGPTKNVLVGAMAGHAQNILATHLGFKPISASYRKALLNDMQTMHTQINFSAHAFSDGTNLMERRLSDLRIPPSPGSLPLAVVQRPIEERLFDATANVKMLTSQVAMHIDRVWRDKLFKQLDFLHSPKDWEEEDEPIQQASFATFLKAIVQIKPAKRPGLGLSYDGHLIAAWTNGPDRLTVEFLQNDRVRWVIGRQIEDESEQIAGQTVVSRLADTLEPYHPEIWFSA